MSVTSSVSRFARRTSIGVTSNGYSVAGGTSGSDDIQFTPQNLPDPARPNNVLASYWTDLVQQGEPLDGLIEEFNHLAAS